MAKLTLTDIDTIDASSIIEAMTDNNTATETAMENTLSRDGTSPNSMEADLDMNSNRILNLPVPENETEPVRLKELNDLVLGEVIIPVPSIADDSITFAKMQEIPTDSLIGRDTAGTGNPESLTVSGGIEFTGTSGLQTSAFTGDVTKTAGSTVTVIANDAVTTGKIINDAVTYAKIQNVSATDRLLGRDTAAAGDVEELTVGGGVEFTGSGGIQRSALTGDVTASAGSNTTTIANDVVTFAKMQNIATDSLIGRDTASTGDAESITLNSTLSFTGSGTIQRAALVGDVTASAGSNTTAIANDVVTNAKLVDMTQSTIKGRAAGAGTGDPTDLTATQATAVLDNFVGDSGAGGTKGLVPAPAAGDTAANKFLFADGTWVVPAGGGTLTRSTATSDNTLARWDGASANVLQSSLITVDDTGNLSTTGNIITTSAVNGAFSVGNVTNPAFWVDSSVGSQNNGWKVVGNTGTSASALRVVGSDVNIPGTIDSAGTGTLTLNNTATGNIVLVRNTSCTNDFTVNGNTTLGNAASDTIVMNAESITKPNAPAWFARKGSNTTDVTGDGTTYTVIFDTELHDRSGDYDNSTGIFTAPVTGLYYVGGCIYVDQLVVGTHTFRISLVSTLRTYQMYEAVAQGTFFNINYSHLVDMTAGNTLSVAIRGQGGAKVVDLLGSTTVFTSFYGYLVA